MTSCAVCLSVERRVPQQTTMRRPNRWVWCRSGCRDARSMLSSDVPLCVPQLVQVSQLDDAMSKIDEWGEIEWLKRTSRASLFSEKSKTWRIIVRAKRKNLRELEISCLSMTRVSHPHWRILWKRKFNLLLIIATSPQGHAVTTLTSSR